MSAHTSGHSTSFRAQGGYVAPDAFAAGDAVVLLATEDDGVLPHRVDTPGLDEALAALGFTGKPGATARVPLGDRSATVVGIDPGTGRDALAATVAGAVRATAGTRRVLVDVEASGVVGHDVAAVHLAGLLATYRFDRYKDAAGPVTEEVLVVGDAPADLDRLDDLVDVVCLARDLTTLPAADKTPARVADLLQDAAAAAGAGFRRYEEDELRDLGMDGLLAVGEASVHRPVLVRLTAAGTGDETVGVVAKGVTYDAGGLNLKLSMLEVMKLDIGGAAAAAGAVLHAARFPRRRGVTVWIGLCENVISGSAYRGGDVLRMHSGLTVEITNTDAEGRLTLADGLSLAAEEEPDALVTVAP